MKTVKAMILGLAALLSCTVVAQAEDAPQAQATDAFALDFSAETDFYNFDDGLLVITPSAGFKLFDVLDATVSLPVYNNTDVTGLGDLNFGVEYGLMQTKSGFFGADNSTLSVNGGVGVPLGGDFASDNLTFTVGGALGMDWGKLGFDQTASYLINTGGDVYAPVFGGFVNENVFTATSTLAYSCTEAFSVGVEFFQAYAGDSKFLSVGPTVGVAFGKTANLDLSVGFPVDQQDMPYGDCDFTVKAGLGFQF